MRVDFRWHAYRYLPYEQILAHRELEVLLERQPVAKADGLSIEGSNGWKANARRTTYFCEAIAEDGSRIVPLQATLEATVKSRGQSELFNVESVPSLRRQSTRYSAHGLHEYRGKFNPQVVRAIGNILGMQPGSLLLDPYCGSGTSLLEAAHIGWNAIGVDLNPLAVQIARAKIAATQVPLTSLYEQADSLGRVLLEKFEHRSFDHAFSESEIRSIGGHNWQDLLPSFDYLCAWFTRSVLVQLSVIMSEINQLPSKAVRLILRVILSDILRQVSLQDPADLRIRRRKFPAANMPVIPLYLNSVATKIATVSYARQHLTDTGTIQQALLGDAQHCVSVIQEHLSSSAEHRFDAAITSPPYATALPYIDTQRLSLVLLGLIASDEIRAVEKSLAGNREITRQERLELERSIEANAEHLPDDCLSLCKELGEALDKSRDGFRRQNVPALVYKYLVNMAVMFEQASRLLRTDAPFALVIGRNKTRLGTRDFVIDTPRLLTSLAEQKGFLVGETLQLDTYQRFDVHKANSIRSETLLILKKG